MYAHCVDTVGHLHIFIPAHDVKTRNDGSIMNMFYTLPPHLKCMYSTIPTKHLYAKEMIYFRVTTVVDLRRNPRGLHKMMLADRLPA